MYVFIQCDLSMKQTLHLNCGPLPACRRLLYHAPLCKYLLHKSPLENIYCALHPIRFAFI